ncbi:hypothetical protein OIP52_000587 [Salmonella enterica]|nr:hypothetical protein [Salmonella enterica]
MNFNHENEVFKTIYAALQSKLVHVQYTTTKALTLQSKMLTVAENKKISVEEVTNVINQIYKYRKKLEKRIQQAGMSKSADEKITQFD